MAIVHANAQTFPQEVLQSNETVLVDFWAAWCGPCKMLAPILEELDGVAPCKIVKVDVDENRALALQYAVASIPTLLVFRNGQLVNRSVGLISREDVLKLVQASAFNEKCAGLMPRTFSHSCSMVRATCPSQERMASSVRSSSISSSQPRRSAPWAMTSREHPAANFLSLYFFFRLFSSIS